MTAPIITAATLAAQPHGATGALTNGTTDMHLLHEELARAQMTARLGEAQTIRRERQLARAIRLSRKAEAVAQQARLAIARTL